MWLPEIDFAPPTYVFQGSPCTEDPLEAFADPFSIKGCFTSVFTVDAFDADGKYLSEVEMPPEIRPYQLGLYVNRDMVVANTEDEDGVVRVKRYRLVLPEDER